MAPGDGSARVVWSDPDGLPTGECYVGDDQGRVWRVYAPGYCLPTPSTGDVRGAKVGDIIYPDRR